MFTQNQKKAVTGLGIGATALGTVLLARRHKKASKKEVLKKEAEAANHNRKRLHDYLNRHDKYHTIKDIHDYGNGVHVDKKGVHVNWDEAKHDIGRIMYHGWVNGIVDGLGGTVHAIKNIGRT